MAAWYTRNGQGPFALLSMSVATRVLNVQAYVAFLNLFVLILAVVVVKEQQARAAAEQAEQRSRFLAIARSIVEALGGSIRVDSTPGHGATFTVELP